MTNKEAIRHLQAARLMLLRPDRQPISDLYDALSIAIEALEKSEDWTDEKLTGMKDKLIERICENCDTPPETRLRLCGECPIISPIREIFSENL